MSHTELQVWRPESTEELAVCVRDAAAHKQALVIQGRGTRPGPAANAVGPHALLALNKLDGVVRHSPGDLSLRARSGLRLADLDALLAEHNQWFPAGAYRGHGSVGGLLASNAEGALQLGYGRAREHLLGATCVHAAGQITKSRGDVVKNVAGYDVARLLAGSHGTLGAYAELALRVFPRPERSVSLRVKLPNLTTAFKLSSTLRSTQLEPVFLNVLFQPELTELVIGFDGIAERVQGQLDATRPLLVPHATGSIELLEGTEERTLREVLDDPVGNLGRVPLAEQRSNPEHAVLHVRTSGAKLVELLPVACDSQALQCQLDVRLTLGSAWLGLHALEAHAVRDALPTLVNTLRRRANVVLHTAPAELRANAQQVWGTPANDFTLMKNVKRALDPNGVFAPGRFVGGL